MTPLRILVFFAALLAALPALADGTVLRVSGCGDKVFVSNQSAFSVLVGAQPGATSDGDKLIGPTERLGFASFYIPQSGRRFSASVDEAGLTKNEVTQRIAATCHAVPGNRIISGYVERAAGCGNKIFVNTLEGYVVMERIAGGVVYAGDTLIGNFGRAGRTTVKDHMTNEELIVFIDDFQLPKSAAQRKITDSCR